MESFIDALKQRNLEKIRAIPKSDLHNHFVLGGSRQYLQEMIGIRIEPVIGNGLMGKIRDERRNCRVVARIGYQRGNGNCRFGCIIFCD